MKRISTIILFILLIINVNAQEKPLRLAIAGVTHGHLGEVASRLDRGDFVIVGVAEPSDKYRNRNVRVDSDERH